jgi:hypothetical protein
MNDDFIKRHKQRPDPKFVERLYQKLNSTPTPQRSYSMFKRTIRPALLVTLALVLAAALTLAFSPAARAAVQALLTFNGVTVSFDEGTGNLVTSGNPDAIVKQSNHEVVIQGKNGDMAAVGVAQPVEGEMVNVSDLLGRYPDLILPTAPAGYTLQPQGQLTSDGSLMFTWTDAAGHNIAYQRSPNPPQAIGPVNAIGGQVNDSGTVSESATLELPAEASAESTPLTTYRWEAGGYYHMLFATDNSLSEADLQAMLH